VPLEKFRYEFLIFDGILTAFVLCMFCLFKKVMRKEITGSGSIPNENPELKHSLEINTDKLMKIFLFNRRPTTIPSHLFNSIRITTD
jgi:hypothetical protein